MENVLIKTGKDTFEKNNVLDIASIVGVITEDAVIIAKIYTNHSNRNIITKKDIELSLKTRTYYNNIFSSLPNVNERLQRCRKILENSDSDSDIEITEEYEEYKKNTCNCEICTKVNNIEEIWKNYTPYETMEIILKKSIEKIT